MELKQLQQHIHTLVTLEENESPVTSLYLDLAQGEDAYRLFVNERFKAIKKNLPTSLLPCVHSTLHQIQAYLAVRRKPSSKGVAIFARPGHDGIFMALEFMVPLPNVYAVSFLPSVYHLFELRDNYHRYVAMILGETNVRILEVSLGEISSQIRTETPDLSMSIDEPVSHQKRQRMVHSFINGQMHILDSMVADKGYTHVILGGSPDMTEYFMSVAPLHLARKIISCDLPRSRHADDEIVELTNKVFAEFEEKESRAAADRLAHSINTTGLAVAGEESTLRALQMCQADLLVMLSSYDPKLSTKNQMVRLAEQSACKVEIAHQSEALDRLGGVGCLLRYKMTS
jgi:hypothetical protein